MQLRNPLFARIYPRLAAAMERRGGAEHRRELLAGLSGRVIEVGAGHGANFAYYPTSVTEILAIEPEPRLREAAETAAADAPVPVTVREGLAAALPAGDDEFDAAVVSLVLCSVPDQIAALTEIARVLRPGGELRFYEHVRSRNPRLARVQRATDLVWPLISGGCHTNRDTHSAIKQAGFEIAELHRFRFPPCRIFLPPSPHILGAAHAPDRAS